MYKRTVPNSNFGISYTIKELKICFYQPKKEEAEDKGRKKRERRDVMCLYLGSYTQLP